MSATYQIKNFILYLLRNSLLIIKETIRNIPRNLISSFGIIFLISFLVFSISLEKTVKDFLEKRIFGQLLINQIKIKPVDTTVMFQLSGKGNSIDDWKIKEINKIKEIKDVEKVIRLDFPTSFKAGLFGKYLRSDMLISGVDKTFFRNTYINWNNFEYKDDQVPVVIPMFAMDLYNNFAASNNLPRLGPDALKLFSMEMIIGQSSFRKSLLNQYKYSAKIFGFTQTLTTAGLIVPSDFIRNFAKTHKNEFQIQGSGYSCIMLVANVKEARQIPYVTKKIRRMNLDVESQSDIAEKTERAVYLINAVMTLIMAVILILTVIAIFNSYIAIVYHRSYRLTIQRFIGTSKLRIVMTFIIEAAIVGIILGIAGYFTGIYLIDIASSNLGKIPMLSGIRLIVPGNMFFYSIIFSTLISSVSALIPAIFAANLNLFKSMKK